MNESKLASLDQIRACLAGRSDATLTIPADEFSPHAYVVQPKGELGMLFSNLFTVNRIPQPEGPLHFQSHITFGRYRSVNFLAN